MNEGTYQPKDTYFINNNIKCLNIPYSTYLQNPLAVTSLTLPEYHKIWVYFIKNGIKIESSLVYHHIN